MDSRETNSGTAMRIGVACHAVLLLLGCDSTESPPATVDASAEASGGGDARVTPDGCSSGEIVTQEGDTCAAFGAGVPCDPACNIPPYGYVCSNGGPPGFAGCVRMSNSALLGGTYCCPDLRCVRVVSRDSACTDAGSASHLYQCATASDGGLVSSPASGCIEVHGLPVYRYFCCRD